MVKEIYINLTIYYSKNQKEELNFHFTYTLASTFENLLEYISSFSNYFICPCSTFYYNNSKIKLNQNISILLPKSDENITSKEIKLQLKKNKCTCSEIFKEFCKSKMEILYICQEIHNLDKVKIISLEEQLEKNNCMSLMNFIKKDEKNCKLYSNTNADDFYDIIINIKSVKDINKGWEIKMNERGKNNYELYKNKEILKIGVIGNANKGKSYLLSKISKIDLPSGTSIRTEGLSIKYPELETFENRKIALLDSAGLETPVLREKEESEEISKELFREKSREKLITELFLQNYIIHNSDILILVVGILTYSEQKLLNRIKT